MITTDEFNKKYKDYLAEGYYGLALSNPEAIKYLDKEFQELIKYPDFVYYQIKLKFNFVRLYCDNIPFEKAREIERKLQEIYDKRNV